MSGTGHVPAEFLGEPEPCEDCGAMVPDGSKFVLTASKENPRQLVFCPTCMSRRVLSQPALLGACEAALSYLPAKDRLRTGEPDGDVQLKIADKLRAAIAQARGGA